MATKTPVLPLILTAKVGEKAALSLGWRVDAGGHITAASWDTYQARPRWVVAALDRRVYAVEADGQVAWRARLAGPAYALAPLPGGWLAAGDDAGCVTLLDGRGRQVWRHQLPSRITALAEAWGGRLLVGGWDERLTLLSIAPGENRVQWQADVGGPVSAVALAPDQVAVATLAGEIRAFNPAGLESWRFKAGVPVVELGVLREQATYRLLAGLQDGRMLALGPNGDLLWQVEAGAGDSGCPVWHAAGGEGRENPLILLGTGGSEPLLALLEAGGRVLWRLSVPAPVGAVASLSLGANTERLLLVGLANGEVRAYDGQGRFRSAVQAGLPVWDLAMAGEGSSQSVLVLADIVAWEMVSGVGDSGHAWLSPPPLASLAPVDSNPEVAMGSSPGNETEATLVFLGDVALGRSVEAQLARFGPAYPWSGLSALLSGADLAAANLECALTTFGQPLDKPYVIRAHPYWGTTLAAAGLGLVTLANNHVLDYGEAGLEETLSVLAEVGIASVGAGRSRAEARRPALLYLNGVRVAVLAYAAARWYDSPDVPATELLAWGEAGVVRADVGQVRPQADLVVVLLHAGTEYEAKPSADQVEVAHAAIDAGADLVVGHHSHVSQTVERYGDGLIVYGLGDALFDIPRQAALLGHLLRVKATRQGLTSAEIWPFWIEDSICPRLLDSGSGRPIVQVLYP